MSAFAIAATGFVGIIATITCMMEGASFTFTAASDTISMPIPGCKTPATIKPMVIAIAVVQR